MGNGVFSFCLEGKVGKGTGQPNRHCLEGEKGVQLEVITSNELASRLVRVAIPYVPPCCKNWS